MDVSTLVNYLRNFWKFFGAASFRHVLAETTTGRFSWKKAAQTFGEEKKGEE